MSNRPNPLGHITGTSRKHPPAIKFGGRAPYAPKSLPEEGKAMWRHLVGILEPHGVLEDVDTYALEVLCSSYAMWKRAVAEYEANPVTPGSRGNMVRSPWGDIANSEAERLRKLLNEFGMTPSARVKLGALRAGTPLDEEIEQLLSR